MEMLGLFESYVALKNYNIVLPLLISFSLQHIPDVGAKFHSLVPNEVILYA